MKIETGVLVMKDGKAWGVEYSDGRSTSYGWVSPEDAEISDPRFCTEPWHVTYQASPDLREVSSGKIVHVERRTEVIIKSN